MPALKVNIIIVHPWNVVFPRAALKVNIIIVHPWDVVFREG
jgi:ABC-type antimicrobial peptide transport system permease subunit